MSIVAGHLRQLAAPLHGQLAQRGTASSSSPRAFAEQSLGPVHPGSRSDWLRLAIIPLRAQVLERLELGHDHLDQRSGAQV